MGTASHQTSKRAEISDPRDIDDLLKDGRAARDSGLLRKALKCFEEALCHDRDSATVYFEIGRTFIELALPWRAAEYLKRGLKLAPNRLDLQLAVARVSFLVGDYPDALARYCAIIDAQSGNLWAHLGAGDALLASGRYRDAIDRFDSVIDAAEPDHPARVLALQQKTVALFGSGKLEDAVALLADSFTGTGEVWTILPSVSQLAAEGALDDVRLALEQLRSVAREALRNWTGYERAVEAVAKALRFQALTTEWLSRDDIDVLAVHPCKPERERAPQRLDLFCNDLDAAAYYHVYPYLPREPAEELPASIRRLSRDDWAATKFPEKLQRRDRPHFTYSLQDCFIFDGAGFAGSAVIYGGSRFVESLVHPLSPLALVRRASRYRGSAPSNMADEVFVLPDNSGWPNYFHALNDVLSCLAIYRWLGLTCPIVVPGALRPIHDQILEATGFRDVKQIRTNSEMAGIGISRAYCPQFTGGQLAIEWWRDVARRLTDHADMQQDRILYISREQATGRRRLVNEATLQAELSEHFDAQIIHAEDLPFEAQVQRAASARVIVAPHGAGLSNMVFASAGSWVVELLPERYLVPVFRELAAVAGHRYVPVVGEVEDLEAMSWGVDVEKVLRLVDEVMKFE
jgi:tetratricopeptide (TPR) repeat protein